MTTGARFAAAARGGGGAGAGGGGIGSREAVGKIGGSDVGNCMLLRMGPAAGEENRGGDDGGEAAARFPRFAFLVDGGGGEAISPSSLLPPSLPAVSS